MSKAPLQAVEAVLERLLAQDVEPPAVEQVPLGQAAGRVLAVPLVAEVAVPPADNSAMDGFAVAAADVVAGKWMPLTQRIAAGDVGQPLAPGSAVRIFTGAEVPSGADCVIAQEDAEWDSGQVRFAQSARVGANVRVAGQDFAVGQELLPSGTRLRPQSLGLAASAGVAALSVYQRLRVAIFSTGNELVAPGQRALAPGQIYDSNRFMMAALLTQLGCEVIDLGVIPDSIEAAEAALIQASQYDVIMSSGGVSVGDADPMGQALAAAGTLILSRLNIKPGKPFTFGNVGRASYLGLPGNPAAVLVTFHVLCRPWLLKLQGQTHVGAVTQRCTAAFSLDRAGGRQQYLRARRIPTQPDQVEIYSNQSSGVLISACWGDGLVVVPPQTTVAPGDPVDFISYNELAM